MNVPGFFNYPTEPQNNRPTIVSQQFWPSRPAEDWKTLLNFAQTLRFSKGDMVAEIGSNDVGFYIISFGRFKVGDTEHNEGDAIGLLPFFDNQPHNAHITAATEGELLYLTHDALDSLAAFEPVLVKEILLELGRILALKLR